MSNNEAQTMRLADSQRQWLERIAETGFWPVRPFLHHADSGPLMRMGLVEVVKPRPEDYPWRSVPLAYAAITDAGRKALVQN